MPTIRGTPPRNNLRVIDHMLGVYKTWFVYRDQFPKKSRYTLGEKIDARFIQILELLFVASYQGAREKLLTLDRAVTGIDTLKFLLQLAWELRLFDDKKYATLSEGVQEVGRQVGGWKKGLQKAPASGL